MVKKGLPKRQTKKKASTIVPIKYLAERDFDQGFGAVPLRPVGQIQQNIISRQIGESSELIGRLKEQERTLQLQIENARKEGAIVNEPTKKMIIEADPLEYKELLFKPDPKQPSIKEFLKPVEGENPSVRRVEKMSKMKVGPFIKVRSEESRRGEIAPLINQPSKKIIMEGEVTGEREYSRLIPSYNLPRGALAAEARQFDNPKEGVGRVIEKPTAFLERQQSIPEVSETTQSDLRRQIEQEARSENQDYRGFGLKF